MEGKSSKERSRSSSRESSVRGHCWHSSLHRLVGSMEIERGSVSVAVVTGMCPPRSCIGHRCTHHVEGSLHAASDRASYLRATMAAVAIVDGYLDDTVMVPCLLHHHFDRATIGHFAPLQRI